MPIHNVGIFGSNTRTNTLLVIRMLRESHASEIAKILAVSLSQVQKAITSLERAGMVVGVMEGRTRRVSINPRLTVRNELATLLDKMALLDLPLQARLAEIRRRPRRSGKAL